MTESEAQLLAGILGELKAIREERDAHRSQGARKPISPTVVWVDETELPDYIPYSLREIRKLRKDGKLRFYPDLRGGKRVLYNLLEVSAKIQGAKNSQLIQFDPEAVRIKL